MNKRIKWINAIMALSVCSAIILVESCSKSDNPPPALTLVSLTAGGVDLNGAASATGVAVGTPIIATFSTNVDATTATDANITFARDYDGATVAKSVQVVGPVVTITPTSSLNSGSLFDLAFTTGLKSAGGKFISQTARTFTTAGYFVPDNLIAHWGFESNTNNDASTGATYNSVTATNISYVDGRNTTSGKAASFNGTTSIVEIPNGDQLMANHNFTLSFWVWADTTQHDQFVLGLAAWKGFQFEIAGYAPGAAAGAYANCKLACQYDEGGSLSDSEDNWFPGNGQTKDNGGWQGWTFNKDVSATGGVGKTYFDVKWCHVVCTYEASTKLATMYLNGDKVKQHDFNLWPAGDAKQGILGVKYAGNTTGGGNNFAIGFIQASGNRIITDSWADPSDPANNHFKGKLDDIRIFGKAVTAAEVTLMYNSENQ